MVCGQNIGASWISVKAGYESHQEQYEWERCASGSGLRGTGAAQSVLESRQMNRDEQTFLRRHAPVWEGQEVEKATYKGGLLLLLGLSGEQT